MVSAQLTLRKQTSKTQCPNFGNKWISVNCGLPESLSSEKLNSLTLVSPNTAITLISCGKLEVIPCTRTPSNTEKDLIIFPSSKLYIRISEPKPDFLSGMKKHCGGWMWNKMNYYSRSESWKWWEQNSTSEQKRKRMIGKVKKTQSRDVSKVGATMHTPFSEALLLLHHRPCFIRWIHKTSLRVSASTIRGGRV